MMPVSLPGDREPAAPVRAPSSLGAGAECLLFQVATECAEVGAGNEPSGTRQSARMQVHPRLWAVEAGNPRLTAYPPDEHMSL